MSDSYYNSGQYNVDPRRTIVWREIIKFISKYIPQNSTVLDLGAGYCDFINQVKAAKKIAVDYSPDLSKYAAEDVEKINSTASDLSVISDESVNVVLSSNLFEHFTEEELQKTINEVYRVLKKGGRIILMGPNFRLQPGPYFDDHTHKKIFTDSSLASFLIENRFKILLNKPKFLPMEMKNSPSILPNFLIPILVKLYIISPFKPMAGQMLVVGEK